MAGRMKELLKKYGKVGLGVHLSLSAASIAGLYVAIKNNVDVESMLQRAGLPSLSKDKESPNPPPIGDLEIDPTTVNSQRNRTAEMAASSGGALALALLINKALLPVRAPITLAVTPQLARFLSRRNLIKNRL